MFSPILEIFEIPESLVFTHIRDRGNYSINPLSNPHKKGRYGYFAIPEYGNSGRRVETPSER